MNRTVLILSGGMDSTVLLYHLLDAGHTVAALSVDYGQRHRVELESARTICDLISVEHRIADLSGCRELFSGSSQTSDDVAVPHGHFTAEVMKATVVPNRNMIMLALAGAWTIARRFDSIAYAAHAGDHAIYPDCRPEFADAINQALALADWHPVKLLRPFLTFTKADICRRGAELGVPFELTYSCYEGKPDIHCGRCGTCTERREAFAVAQVPDPTIYVHDSKAVSV